MSELKRCVFQLFQTIGREEAAAVPHLKAEGGSWTARLCGVMEDRLHPAQKKQVTATAPPTPCAQLRLEGAS